AGTRLCPPAKILASSPCSARSSRALSIVRGAKYRNATGFIVSDAEDQANHANCRVGQVKVAASRDRISSPEREWPLRGSMVELLRSINVAVGWPIGDRRREEAGPGEFGGAGVN